jgi:hypothetical protein
MMNRGSRFFTGNPLRMSVARGNASIQCHCPLRVHPWTVLDHKSFEGGDQSSSFGLANADFNGNPGISNSLNSLTGDMGRRILAPHNNSPKPGSDDGLRARRGFSEMAAGFE